MQTVWTGKLIISLRPIAVVSNFAMPSLFLFGAFISGIFTFLREKAFMRVNIVIR